MLEGLGSNRLRWVQLASEVRRFDGTWRSSSLQVFRGCGVMGSCAVLVSVEIRCPIGEATN